MSTEDEHAEADASPTEPTPTPGLKPDGAPAGKGLGGGVDTGATEPGGQTPSQAYPT